MPRGHLFQFLPIFGLFWSKSITRDVKIFGEYIVGLKTWLQVPTDVFRAIEHFCNHYFTRARHWKTPDLAQKWPILPYFRGCSATLRPKILKYVLIVNISP